MLAGIKKYLFLFNQYIAIFIVGILAVTTFTCVTMTASSNDHSGESTVVCEMVMNLTNNIIVQTGVMVLVLLATIYIGRKTRLFSTLIGLRLSLFVAYHLSIIGQVTVREYSYLHQLFSSGLIHSKLYRYTV